MKVDKTGRVEKQFFLLPADAYTGTLTKVEGPVRTEYKGDVKMKVIMTCTIPSEGGKTFPLQLWVPLVVTRGGRGKDGKVFSNSKLFDILSLAGELDAFFDFANKSKNPDGTLEEAKAVEFLQRLVGREARFDVAVKQSAEGRQYSTVSDIKRFTDGPVVVEQIQA